MKKKLFFFGTCFFLLSALTIFFAFRNTQLSKITKNKEEEVKRLLKELKEQKEKSNLNQKNENEDCQEETDDLPWLLNWIGATISLVVCGLIAVPGRRIITEKIPVLGSYLGYFVLVIIDFILLTILFFIPFPFLFAIAKYKDKSYKERYRLLWRSYWKPFVYLVLGTLFALLTYFYNNLFKDTDNKQKTSLPKKRRKKHKQHRNRMVNINKIVNIVNNNNKHYKNE